MGFISEQEGGTLLSSITVLSDSVHIGSMSPSNTIHLGPVWKICACSLISDENRPNTGRENKESDYKENALCFQHCFSRSKGFYLCSNPALLTFLYTLWWNDGCSQKGQL